MFKYWIRFGIGAIVGITVCASLSMATEATPEPKAGLPNAWDERIPIPKDAVLVSQTEPKTGVVHSAQFSVPGDYDKLVDFYQSGLKQNGFDLGSPVKVPARKVYSVSFS